MKKIVSIAFASVLLVASSYGQGTILGSNAGANFSAPIYDVDGTTPLAGNTFLAQIYAGTSADSLNPLGSPVAFLTGASEGFFFAGTLPVPGIPGGATATILVRAWSAASGATYEEASQSVGGKFGESNIFTVVLGNPAGTPPTTAAALSGMQSFALVPEPSVIALAILGAGALFFRRKKA